MFRGINIRTHHTSYMYSRRQVPTGKTTETKSCTDATLRFFTTEHNASHICCPLLSVMLRSVDEIWCNPARHTLEILRRGSATSAHNDATAHNDADCLAHLYPLILL